MWILKQYKDSDGNIICEDIELEQNETEQSVSDYERKYFPNCKFNFTSPTHQTGFSYHKVDNVKPHINVIQVK